MTIKRHSFWWENSPPDFALQPQLPATADLIIVGAGFAGVSTAYWALRYAKKQKKQFRIVILEEAPHPAFKATGRMTGSVYLGDNGTAKAAVDRYGEKVAKQLYSYSSQNNKLLCDLVERGIDCEAEFNGGFRMASTAKEVVALDESKELLSDWGFSPVRFDSNQSQHIVIAPYVKGSLYIPHEGMFDPFAFTNKIARILRRNGVWIVYGARVAHSATSKERGPEVHLENGHVMSAPKIVHTTVNTPPWYEMDQHVVHKREQVVKTEPLSADLDDMPLPNMPIELCGGLESVRIYRNAILMTGGKSGLRRDPELNVTDDTFQNQKVLDYLDSTMVKHFPVANHMNLSHTWTYIETTTSDGLPLMGEVPGTSGHFVNVAHGKNKFGLAFLGAKNVAERALRVKMQNPEFKIFDPQRLMRGE